MKIPLLTIESIAVRHILRISRYYIKFKYLDHKQFKSVTRNDIHIKNVLTSDTEFLIRTDDLAPNFCIHYKNLKNVTLTDVALAFCLGPEEKLSLPFEFKPSMTGTHTIQLPIYIRGYGDGSVYNFITLRGFYPKVVLQCDPELTIRPIPLKEIAVMNLSFTAMYHTKDCAFKVVCDIPQVTIVYINGRNINCKELISEQSVSISFSSDKPLSLHVPIHIKCDCGGETITKLMVCADSSTITTHMYTYQNCPEIPTFRKSVSVTISEDIIPVRELSHFRFPYFCLDTDKSNFSVYMHKIVKIVERWVFDQVMFGRYFFTIPDNMSDVCLHLETSKSPQSKQKKNLMNKYVSWKPEDMLVIVMILVNLLGDTILPVLISR